MTQSGLTGEKPGTITPKILGEQTRFSYDVFPVTVSMLAISVCLIGYLAWEQIGRPAALYWFAAASGVLALRVVLFALYKRADPPLHPLWWRRAFLTGVFASGGLTCLAAILFFNDMDEPSRLVFALLVVGIVSGAVPVLATDLKSYAIYLFMNVMPLSLFNLADTAMASRLVGAVMLIYIGMLMMAAHLFNRALLDSMIYRYRSELLADRLQTANQRLSSANQELQRMSTVDELTGVFNRRFFNQRFREVWADHVREGQSLAALMIDVDHFKAYNDHLGHLQGDYCLKRLANEITGVIRRPRDFVARFGGEEFVMLLPNTDMKGAREIGERIHARIENLSMPQKRDDGINRVTVSIGGAAIRPTKDNDSDAFLQRIDQALYQAKHTGRNTSIFL